MARERSALGKHRLGTLSLVSAYRLLAASPSQGLPDILGGPNYGCISPRSEIWIPFLMARQGLCRNGTTYLFRLHRRERRPLCDRQLSHFAPFTSGGRQFHPDYVQ